jgi:DNA polymerase-3 subunit delta'
LLEAGTHPDLQQLSFVPTKTGDKLRTEIVIEQIRELSERLALTSQYGQAQVAIVDPADAINRAAANALLKTLGRTGAGALPVAGVGRPDASAGDHPQPLPAAGVPLATACRGAGLAGGARPCRGAAREALEAARGHPGLADDWLRTTGWRCDATWPATSIVSRPASSARSKRRSVERRRASGPAPAPRRRAGRERAAQAGLTDPVRLHKLAAWFDAANRTCDLLRTTVRADLAVAELLLAWRDAQHAQAAPRG